MSDGTLTIDAGEDVLVALLGAMGPDIVARIPAPDTAAERQFIRSAVAVAAERRAPTGRVNAVVIGAAALPAAVAGAIAFLRGAQATTGQTLDVD